MEAKVSKKITKEYLLTLPGMTDVLATEIIEYQEDKKHSFLNFVGNRRDRDTFQEKFKKDHPTFKVHESDLVKMSHLTKNGYSYKTKEDYYYFFLLDSMKEINYFKNEVLEEEAVLVLTDSEINKQADLETAIENSYPLRNQELADELDGEEDAKKRAKGSE